ncbi:MAG: ABC transporter substrate-binding protein [Planctomycetota bacterium]
MKKWTVLFLIFITALMGCSKKTPSEATTPGTERPVTLKVGHVGHDHHLALFAACDYAEQFDKTGITLKKVLDQKRYALYENAQKIADVEIVRVGGGSKMPAALAQGVIDIGFGGVAPVMASTDSGAPIKLISPLHSKGDMFVVKPDSTVNTWEDFVKQVKQTQQPLRIGYKNPVAVAKLIFEDALQHEGISFSQDSTQTDVQIHLINTKGGGKLNVSLAGGLIDGYVGNNPFPSIAVEKKMGKIICDLEDLPPGNFKNHPCCCIAANETAIQEKAAAIKVMLVLCQQATNMINRDTDKAVSAATRWIGTSETVERMSIPTSSYNMDPSDDWQTAMNHWIKAMNTLGTFTGKLKGLTPQEACTIVYDMELLEQAKQQLEKANI